MNENHLELRTSIPSQSNQDTEQEEINGANFQIQRKIGNIYAKGYRNV